MRRTLLLTAAVPLLLLVGGGSAVASAAPAPAPMTDPSGDPEERIREFVQCMREHGIDLPDPTESDGPVRFEIGSDEKEAFDSAREACDEFAPPHAERVELDPALRGQIDEFHECLRDHGLDIPEPGAAAGGIAVSLVAEAGVAGPVLHESGEARPATPPPGAPHPPEGEMRVVTPLPGSEEAVEACRDLLPVPPGGGAAAVVVGTAGEVAVGQGDGIGITVAVPAVPAVGSGA
ncbi:hypothetical protein [Pseudonocardia lacus]|uniref:hypothetical protein n=1 Tax=Pseudonocardia lacus TaxID=2835865 RepID=UPI001BDD6109|nr:hypothetical protein [Pseudonocardia lacus]